MVSVLAIEIDGLHYFIHFVEDLCVRAPYIRGLQYKIYISHHGMRHVSHDFSGKNLNYESKHDILTLLLKKENMSNQRMVYNNFKLQISKPKFFVKMYSLFISKKIYISETKFLIKITSLPTNYNLQHIMRFQSNSYAFSMQDVTSTNIRCCGWIELD